MLQRGNSDAAKRVRRAKSTTSATSRLSRRSTQIDPEQAKQDATTAAIRAYDHTFSQMDDSARISNVPKPALQRQGSHLARSLSGAGNNARHSTSKLKKSRSKEATGKSRQSESVPLMSAVPLPTSLAQSTARIDFEPRAVFNTGHPQGPPTRAQIRKARSSLALRPPTPLLYEYDDSRHIFDNLPSLTRNDMPLRPQRAAREQQTDEAILAHARDLYLEERLIPPPQPRRSSILAPFISRRRKPIRQSLETDVSFDGPTIEIDRILPPVLPAEPSKGRRFSMTLKNTWRRAMGRSSDSSSGDIPPQQIEATEAHYGDPIFRRRDAGQPPTTSLASRRVSTSTETHLTDAPLTPPPRFRDQGHSIVIEKCSHSSLRSLLDIHPGRSRVTSWADTTADNTLALPDHVELPSIIESNEHSPSSKYQEVHNLQPTTTQTALPSLKKRTSRFQLSANAVDSRKLLSALRNHMTSGRASDGTSEARDVSSSTTQTHITTMPLSHSNVPEIRLPNMRAVSAQTLWQSSSSAKPSLPSSADVAVAVNVGTSRRNKYYNDPRTFPPTVRKRMVPPGSAIVTESQPVLRWPVGHRQEGSSGTEPFTSGEWRTWAADEFVGFEGGPFTSVTEPVAIHGNFEDIMVSIRDNLTVPVQITEQAAVNQHPAGGYPSIFNHYAQPNRRSSPDMIESFPGNAEANRESTRSRAPSSRHSSRTQREPGPHFNEHNYSKTMDLGPLHNMLPPRRVSLVPRGSPDEKLRVRRSKVKSSHLAPPVETTASATTQRLPIVSKRSAIPVLAESRANRSPHTQNKFGAETAPLDDKFLYRIQRGPYELRSPSPAAASPSIGTASEPGSTDLLAGRRPFRRIGKGPAMSMGESNENNRPTEGMRMVDEYLGKRAERWGYAQSSSPQAFL